MMATIAERRPVERDRYGSAADYAYAALRREIVEGRFAPGRRMREIELASWLGISRTPTRQALSRLEVEGLVALQPRAGLVVSTLDAAATEELYEMRSALEGTAAAMAARHGSARDVEALVQLVETEGTLPEDPAIRYRHNLAFHGAIYQAAHNRYLMKSLQALNDAIALLGPTTMGMEGRLADAHEEHRRIVAAIAAKDGEEADREARAHVGRALDLRRRMRGAADGEPGDQPPA
jgi:DNA-binding GntR family transcriptional regulator